jgi:protease-4
MQDSLKSKLGIAEDKDINFASIQEYDKSPALKESGKPKKWEVKQKIAVVYGAGEINSGKADGDGIGSATLSNAIRDAAKDTAIKAIVLRINSPGGSALASDVIWRELEKAKVKKPVVVSMGGLAASGGYYIACNADRIFAGNNTITGSIGVFGVLPNAQGLFNNKLGIRFDGVNTNQNSNIGMPTRPLSPYQYEVIQNSVEQVYTTFLSHVAQGRNMTPAAVDSIGQGRVWTGKDALGLGLVDEIGGLKEAIAYAAKKVEIENYRVVSFPEQKTPFEEFKANFSTSTLQKIAYWYLGDYAKFLKYTRDISKIETIQTRLPFEYIIY